ncbi:MAG: hypothetical protein LBR26_13175 [Prevotella sp.]|jgi:hypothetical protein|nr:hypothetical protein [Prevotella sp.]
MTEIIVKHRIKKQIKEALKTTYPTIRSALFGMTNTETAIKIREKALELGGVEVVTNNSQQYVS